MKRIHAEIKMYDYTTYGEFLAHKDKMKERGYRLIMGEFGGGLDAGSLIGSEKYEWTASYIKENN